MLLLTWGLMSALTTIFFLWAMWLSGVQQSPAGTVVLASGGPWPNLESNIGRPLRYRPDGNDFVIVNGADYSTARFMAQTPRFAWMRAIVPNSFSICPAAAVTCAWA